MLAVVTSKKIRSASITADEQYSYQNNYRLHRQSLRVGLRADRTDVQIYLPLKWNLIFSLDIYGKLITELINKC